MSKLQTEIRTAFSSYDQIDATSTIPLKYLHAVALEGMRIYAPLPFALPRVVPEGGDTVEGHFLPAGVGPLLALMSFHPYANAGDLLDHCLHQPCRRLPLPGQLLAPTRLRPRALARSQREGSFGRRAAFLTGAEGLSGPEFGVDRAAHNSG